MSEEELQECLINLLDEFANLADDDRAEIGFESMDWLEGSDVRSFSDAHLVISQKGVVLNLANGEGEFQITIVRSR